jgi:hypothetical protein
MAVLCQAPGELGAENLMSDEEEERLKKRLQQAYLY